jgi:cell division protein FtsI/penicillin-binding protein 2
MKKLSITIILLLSSVLFACKGNKSNPADTVKSIRFKFTELGRETMFRITCDKFDFYFPESKVKNFTTTAGIDSVMQLLTTLSPINDGSQPDVRGKIYITHVNNTTDTLCVGTKVLNYKNVTYQTPQELLVLIQK